jgi:tetratricopeptide (TPR) repeat protein
VHIRASPWITQALSSEIDLSPQQDLKQKPKTNSCGFIAVACAFTVIACPGSFAKPESDAAFSAKGQKVATASANTASKTLKMAQFHTTRREFKEAIELWTKLAESKPYALAEANLGWSYLQMGDKQKAQKHINRSIQLNPRTIEGYRYLGYFLMGEGKVPDAIKAFRTSMSFDPHHKCNCGDLEKLVLSKSKNRKP